MLMVVMKKTLIVTFMKTVMVSSTLSITFCNPQHSCEMTVFSILQIVKVRNR